VNNSPFAGREGKYVTARQIKDRLDIQLETDVSLRVDQGATPDQFIVSGRGELHLSILIENMRREGYELQVSKPEGIVRAIDGKKPESSARLHISVPSEHAGSVIAGLSQRKGEMLDMETVDEQTKLVFVVPSRGLLGYTSDFMTTTHG